ncbi:MULTISPECIES: ROK family protein [Paenibacillus]|uniref:Sugar kinase n=1 Tax=Paenibacillus odorifer TaxID=189426 RepID=A0A1R0XA84_9BACL|nr:MULTISPECIES: ROK family protein [Paenibacillus]ETT46192.1 ROK family protein [Paenibacillus sp. FSL H8-237]MEC0129719.1 ROK family protein [Paenibacillus odorifer]MEC0224037.1 ROK family protein [Paenibacillus odorifer]OMC97921.1 sugar kinase [Paenibacillus odorifer]OMD02877.1 sugar kinase [Paenibacillus odorifer]
MQKVESYVVGIDLGGTKIAAALFDSKGTVLKRELMETAGARTAKEVVQRMIDMIRSVSEGRPLTGVGLASPGAVNSQDGIVIHGTNLPEWDNVPLKHWMESELGVEVKVVNDANAAAWGEYVRGAGKGADNMVYVTFSTGIGAGIVIDGKLLLGKNSFAGELGHNIIDPNGTECSCGRFGCWEVFASGTAIRDMALRSMESRPSMITELANINGEKITSRHVFEAMALNDAVAVEVIDRSIHYMALGLANAVHTFNPDRIVIGGGVSKAGDLLFPALVEKTEQFVMDPYKGTFTIEPAALKDDVGLIGAAALFHTA